MVMNRKGVMKIIEASISIIIIMGVLFFVFSQSNQVSLEDEDFNELNRDLLEEIALKPKLRQAVLTDTGRATSGGVSSNNLEINEFLSERLSEYPLNYSFKICLINDACGLSKYHGNVYAQERVISADVTKPKLAPKKIRLFLWRET